MNMTTKLSEPCFQLPPLTLSQLDQLKVLLEIASAREADPESEVFQLLKLVHRTRVDAIKSIQ